jgi:hypothetical protein
MNFSILLVFVLLLLLLFSFLLFLILLLGGVFFDPGRVSMGTLGVQKGVFDQS